MSLFTNTKTGNERRSWIIWKSSFKFYKSFAFKYLSFMSYINLIYIEEGNENYILLTILVSKMPQKSYFGTLFSLAT